MGTLVAGSTVRTSSGGYRRLTRSYTSVRGSSVSQQLRAEDRAATLEKKKKAQKEALGVKAAAQMGVATALSTAKAAGKKLTLAAPYPQGNEYNIHIWQSCAPGYVKRFKPTTKGWYCLRESAIGTVADTAIAEDTGGVTEAVECPRGTVYDAPTFGGCDPGYRLEKRWGFDTCICEVRDPYVPDADKTARGIGLGGLESLTDMLPTLIVGGIIIAAMGMLKK